MPANDSYANKLLTDAKAAGGSFAVHGLATGQAPLDEAHTPTSASFDTGALYLDQAPAGSRAAVPTSSVKKDET